MIKIDLSHTVEELDLILAGLRKLPFELVADLHHRLNVEGKDQFDDHPENTANQKPETDANPAA